MTVSNNRRGRGRPLMLGQSDASATSLRLERRLAELVTRASQARVALRGGGLGPALADSQHEDLRRAVVEMVGSFDAMVGDMNARLVSLRGMIQTISRNY